VKKPVIIPSFGLTPVLERDTGETAADEVQARLVRAVDQTSRSPGVNRHLVEAVELPGGATALPISHGLGTVPTSWAVAGMRANAIVWEPDPTRRDESAIYLLSSASCVFDLEVW